MDLRGAARFLLLAAAGAAFAPAPPAFEGARAWEHLRQVVALGPRPSGSQAAADTRAYIAREIARLGLQASEQPFLAGTPIGRLPMANVRVLIPGRGRGRLVIGGHYDTKRFLTFPFVGANDGGSSTAVLLELARVLAARRGGMPVELLFLDGEEATGDWQGTDHTYGSRHYVEAMRRAGTLGDVRAFILVDMVGDRDLVLKRESASTPWLTDLLWNTARRLHRPEFSNDATPIEDDHLSFLEAGVPAVDLIDLEYTTRTGAPAWHTADDTLENVSARSLEAVGTVLAAALPDIERTLAGAATSRSRSPRESPPRSAPPATASPARTRGR